MHNIKEYDYNHKQNDINFSITTDNWLQASSLIRCMVIGDAQCVNSAKIALKSLKHFFKIENFFRRKLIFCIKNLPNG